MCTFYSLDRKCIALNAVQDLLCDSEWLQLRRTSRSSINWKVVWLLAAPVCKCPWANAELRVALWCVRVCVDVRSKALSCRKERAWLNAGEWGKNQPIHVPIKHTHSPSHTALRPQPLNGSIDTNRMVRLNQHLDSLCWANLRHGRWFRGLELANFDAAKQRKPSKMIHVLQILRYSCRVFPRENLTCQSRKSTSESSFGVTAWSLEATKDVKLKMKPKIYSQIYLDIGLRLMLSFFPVRHQITHLTSAE